MLVEFYSRQIGTSYTFNLKTFGNKILLLMYLYRVGRSTKVHTRIRTYPDNGNLYDICSSWVVI